MCVSGVPGRVELSTCLFKGTVGYEYLCPYRTISSFLTKVLDLAPKKYAEGGSSERERKNLNAWIEELDLELPVNDGF